MNFQTKRMGNRIFFIQCSQNSFGKFIKIFELDLDDGMGVIMIPKSKNGIGWDIFIQKIAVFVGILPFGFSTKNKGNHLHAKRSKPPKGAKTSHCDLPNVTYMSVVNTSARKLLLEIGGFQRKRMMVALPYH